MSNISLKAYLEQIDTMLDERRYEESVFHCRHILQQLPKNVAAYRRLSRGLMETGQWQEAGDILRRVLSVTPDDQRTHLALSRVYHRLREPDRAIWHLERAWEHDPNNQTLIDELKEMYYEHRGLQDVRLQLTAGAVARQYARNDLHDQAITVLRKTLDQTPQREDLRLLLARVQHESGQQVDAAETALEIIASLPDCLEANLMLAELWLSERRPSDAQRYLSRIEPVDPYTALKLAQGQTPDESAVEIEFGDYQRAAEHALSQAQPDWLEDIGQDNEATAEGPSRTDAAESTDSDAEPETVGAADDNDAIDDDFLDFETGDTDWLGDVASAASASEDDTDAVKRSEFDDFLQDQRSNTAASTGLTGLLASLGKDDDESDATAESSPTSGDDDLDEVFASLDMDDSGSSESEEDESQEWWPGDSMSDFTFDEETTEEDGTPDSVADDAETSGAGQAASVDEDDPLAWLRDSGVELLDEDSTQQSRLDQYAVEEDDSPLQDPTSDDPMAWLRDSGVEFVEDVDDESTADNREAEASDQLDPNDLDPMAWMHESGIEVVDEEDNSPESPEETPAEAQEADSEASAEDLFKAFDETPDTADEHETTGGTEDDALLDEIFEMESLTSGDDTSPDEEPPIGETPSTDEELVGASSVPEAEDASETGQDIMSDQGSEERPDWFNDDSSDDTMDESEWLGGEPFAEQDDTEAEAAGASDEEQDEQMDESESEDLPDWLADVSSEAEDNEESEEPAEEDREAEPVAEEDLPDWLADVSSKAEDEDDAASEEPVEEAEPVAEEDLPDWLADVSSEAEDEDDVASEEPVEEAEPMSEGDLPDWLADVSSEAEDEDDVASEEPVEEAEPVAEEDLPDWLADVSSEAEDEDDAASEEPVEEAEPMSEGDLPDWLSEAEDESSSDEETEEQEDFASEPMSKGDLADWLDADIEETDEEEAAAPQRAKSEGDLPSWLADLSTDDVEVDEELNEETEEPTWLNETEDELDNAFVAQSNDLEALDWLTEMDSEESEEEATESATEEDLPDWMSEAETGETEDEEDIDALFGGTEDDADELEAEEDLPDWMSETSPTDDTVPGAPLSFAEDTQEAEQAEDEGETQPDWFSEETGAALDAAALGWLDEDETETTETETADAAETGDDILTDMDFAPQPDMEATDAGEAADETTETEVISASNAPDWLNMMAPGFDIDYEAEEDQPIEQRYIRAAERSGTQQRQDFAWLIDLVAEEQDRPPEVTEDNLPGQGEPEQEPEPAQARPRRRFQFTRPPAWLQNTSGQAATAATSPAVDNSDTVNDEDEDIDEIPPWLEDADEDDLDDLFDDDLFDDQNKR